MGGYDKGFEKETRLELCPQFTLDCPWVETEIDEKLIILVRISLSDVLEVPCPLHDGVSHRVSIVNILFHAENVFVQTTDFQRQQSSYTSAETSSDEYRSSH